MLTSCGGASEGERARARLVPSSERLVLVPVTRPRQGYDCVHCSAVLAPASPTRASGLRRETLLPPPPPPPPPLAVAAVAPCMLYAPSRFASADPLGHRFGCSSYFGTQRRTQSSCSVAPFSIITLAQRRGPLSPLAVQCVAATPRLRSRAVCTACELCKLCAGSCAAGSSGSRGTRTAHAPYSRGGEKPFSPLLRRCRHPYVTRPQRRRSPPVDAVVRTRSPRSSNTSRAFVAPACGYRPFRWSAHVARALTREVRTGHLPSTATKNATHGPRRS